MVNGAGKGTRPQSGTPATTVKEPEHPRARAARDVRCAGKRRHAAREGWGAVVESRSGRVRQAMGGEAAVADAPHDLLGSRLLYVRWATVGTLLTLALVQPLVGREGWPTWLLILVFAGYSLGVELLARRLAVFRRPGAVSALDLAVISLLYSMGATPAGALFVLFVLVVVWAAATNSFPLGPIFIGCGLVAVAVISPTLPQWVSSATSIRELLARLVFMALAGGTTAVLAGYVDREREVAAHSRAHAERQAELNRLRGAFVSAVSHDLRTPLTAIRAGLGLLDASLGDRLRPDEGQLLAAARRNCDRLGLLVDDLLAYHQIEAGAMQLVRTSLDLRDVVTASVAAVRPLLAEKGQRVEIDMPERLPYTGDVRRLEHVLVNLLANAHHHTPPGTIVRVAGRAAPGAVALTVSDDGPGIPAAELDHIFERFYRVAPTTAGSGLGLAIAKGVVELHGGHIWAERETPRGAAFRLVLPTDQTRGM